MQTNFRLLHHDKTATILQMQSDLVSFSNDAAFYLHLISSNIGPDALQIGDKATISVVQQGTATPFFTGIISELSPGQKTGDGQHMQLTLRSPWHLLDLQQHNRVYVQKSLPDILKDVFTQANIDLNFVKFHLQQHYQPLPSEAQYQETDAQFVQRLLSHYGLFCCYQTDAQNTELHIYDNCKDLPMGSISQLDFASAKGLQRSTYSVLNSVQTGQLQTSAISLRDHSRGNASSVLHAAGYNAAGHGEKIQYGQHFSNNKQGKALQLVRQQALEVERQTQHIRTDCPELQLGQVINIGNSHRTGFEKPMRVIGLQHYFQQTHLVPIPVANKSQRKAIHAYKNRVTLIPADLAFNITQQQTKPITSALTATIDALGSDKKHIDAAGNYKVNYSFDENKHQTGQGSAAISAAQPGSGQNSGLHFPMQKGTEVLLQTINGDINRPVIVGAIANDDNPNVVTAENNTQHLWQTYTGHQVLFDDGNESQVRLNTPKQYNQLQMLNTETPQLNLNTEKGEMLLAAGNTYSETVGNNVTYNAKQNHNISVKDHYTLKTNTGAINFNSGANLTQRATAAHSSTSKSGGITINAKQNINTDSKNDQHLYANDTIHVQTPKGSMYIKANKGIEIIAPKGFTMAQAKGLVSLDEQGNLNISGNSVNVQGNNIILNSAQLQEGDQGQAAPLPQQLPQPLHWVQARYLDAKGNPITKLPYTITTADGTKHQGILNGAGQTERIKQLKPGAAKITFGDKEKLEQQLVQERQKLQQTLNAIIAKNKEEAKVEKQEAAHHSWLTNQFIANFEELESFGDGVEQGAVGAVKGIIKLFGYAAQTMQAEQDGQVASLNGDTAALNRADNQMIDIGKKEYGWIGRGIDLLNFLCKDKPTRTILENFAHQYYESSTPLMLDKHLAEIVGGMIPAIMVAVVTKDPASFLPEVAESTEFAELGPEIGGLTKTLEDVEKCEEIDGAELDREHVVRSKISDSYYRTPPKEIAKHLKENGYSKEERLRTLKSFDLKNTKLRIAGDNEYGLRYFDNIKAHPKGRYLFKSFPASREDLALDPKWNQMTYLKQWKIRPGSTIIEGPASAQGKGLPGQKVQIMVLDAENDLLENN